MLTCTNDLGIAKCYNVTMKDRVQRKRTKRGRECPDWSIVKGFNARERERKLQKAAAYFPSAPSILLLGWGHRGGLTVSLR